MHKIEIKTSLCIGLSCLLFIFLIFCVNKNQELHDFTAKKYKLISHKNNISKLSNEISKCSFNFIKPFNATGNFKNIIKETCKKYHIENALFKFNAAKDKYCEIKNIEIKFSTKHERNIYDFIIGLQNKLDEIIIFDEIKIIKKDKHNFVTKIQFRLLLPDTREHKKSIIINSLPKNIFFNIKSICLFPKDEETEKYTLHCIINNSKAYINDKWVNIGDELDDFKIKNIYPNSIDVQHDNEVVNISIGSNWK